MGLDMYLTRKRYVKNWQHTPEKQKHLVQVSQNGEQIDTSKIQTLEFEEMCWRKANQIHNWFVENVQEGEDDCKEYYVSVEKLEQLLDDIQYCLKNKDHAEKVLPTSAGFFFGSQEYDEWYWEDLQETADTLEELLNNEEALKDDFYYQSSW